MPNTELVPTGQGADDDWTLVLGVDKWSAVAKPDDDAATYIHSIAAPTPKQSCTYADLVGVASIIVSVNLDCKGKSAGAPHVSRYRGFWKLGAQYAYTTYIQPGDAWVDEEGNFDDMACPDTASWSRSKVNAAESGVEHNLNAGGGIWVTTCQGNVDWLPSGSGGYSWLLQSWLLPILPFVGGAVDVMRELNTYFAQLRTKPSIEEDFRRISEWLQCRPVTLALHSPLAVV